MSSPNEGLELPDEIVRDAVPDDDIVLAYVTRGAMARYVEGVAAKNAEFREELLACIDGLEESGEAISALARAWREPSVAVVSIHQGVPRKRSAVVRWAPFALAAAFFLAVGIVHHQKQEEEARQREAAKAAELAEMDRKVAQLHEDLQKQQEAIATAQMELVAARDDAERARAQHKLSAAQAEQRATMSSVAAVKAGAGRPKSSGAKPACNCQPGDPLCSCL